MGSQSCAFCKYHNRFMTVKKLKRKHCLSRMNGEERGDCKHLIRLIRHPFWVPIEAINNKHRYKTIKRKIRG